MSTAASSARRARRCQRRGVHGVRHGPGERLEQTETMNHRDAPVLDALREYHEFDRYGFTPPGHRQGRGIDPRVREIMGLEPFRADLLASSGLDDRLSSGGYLQRAEELMADAVGAQHAFFSTCGSSLSVKAAMLAVAGHDGHLILGRDVHKSVTAGLIFSGLQPCWVRPQWDPRLHIAHPPSREQLADAWTAIPRRRCADRQSHAVRNLRGHRGDRRDLPRARAAADRRRSLGRAPALPRPTARPGRWTPAPTSAS